MSTVAATFTRIERALWVAAVLSLVALLGLGLPQAMAWQGVMPWEWVARIALALLGIAALVARVCLQRGRRRVEELCARVAELEAQASSPRPAMRAEPAAPLGVLEALRVTAADIERHARAAEELARVAEGEAQRGAASIDVALGMLREAGPPERSPLTDPSGPPIHSRLSESVAAVAERLAVMGSQHVLLSQRAVELVRQIEAVAASQASLASGLAALEEISDRADALALRCGRADRAASAPTGDIASELAGVAQEMAASLARTQRALSTGRDASSRALIAARDHASEAGRMAHAERELATVAGALELQVTEAASASAENGRSIEAMQASVIARAIAELGERQTPGDAARRSEELEELLRETGHLQALIARLADAATP